MLNNDTACLRSLSLSLTKAQSQWDALRQRTGVLNDWQSGLQRVSRFVAGRYEPDYFFAETKFKLPNTWFLFLVRPRFEAGQRIQIYTVLADVLYYIFSFSTRRVTELGLPPGTRGSSTTTQHRNMRRRLLSWPAIMPCSVSKYIFPPGST